MPSKAWQKAKSKKQITKSKKQKAIYFMDTQVDQIRIKLAELLIDFKKKYPIESLAIFGSYARGDQTDQSDLDLLVEFNDRIGIRFVDLAEELERKLGMKVDLVSRKGVKDSYFKEISKDLLNV